MGCLKRARGRATSVYFRPLFSTTAKVRSSTRPERLPSAVRVRAENALSPRIELTRRIRAYRKGRTGCVGGLALQRISAHYVKLVIRGVSKYISGCKGRLSVSRARTRIVRSVVARVVKARRGKPAFFPHARHLTCRWSKTGSCSEGAGDRDGGDEGRRRCRSKNVRKRDRASKGDTLRWSSDCAYSRDL